MIDVDISTDTADVSHALSAVSRFPFPVSLYARHGAHATRGIHAIHAGLSIMPGL